MSNSLAGTQLTFEFSERSDFYLSDYEPGSNASLVERLTAITSGEPGHVYLQGGEGTGKTHLLLAMCRLAQDLGDGAVYAPLKDMVAGAPSALDSLAQRRLVCVDDIDAVSGNPSWCVALFNLWNACESTGAVFLGACRVPVHSLDTGLDDLDSRLRASLQLRLTPLEDADREGAMRRLAARRGVDLPAEVARYLLHRMPRDMHSLADTVAALDKHSLARRRRITVPLAREWLDSGP